MHCLARPQTQKNEMVSKGDKRRLAANAQFLRRFRVGIVSSNAIYVAVRMVLKSSSCTTWHYVAFALTGVLLYIVQGSLKHALEPAYDAAGELIFAGSDLTQGGALSYYQDVAYLGMFALVVGAFTNYAWLVMLCIPMYACFMLYTYVIRPWMASRGGAPVGTLDATADAALRKRQAKKERQQKRMDKFRRPN